jgi:hypothetical protein
LENRDEAGHAKSHRNHKHVHYPESEQAISLHKYLNSHEPSLSD